MPSQPPKLLDQMHAALRARHYPAHAKEAAVAWITRHIFFHDKRHPTTLGALADVRLPERLPKYEFTSPQSFG
ncbi:MAG: hypothetical protein CVU38_06700 [Chloroflexi bacterium HGW-Chloroflexi-1]|nr:MAG: hypothetical protein CVU38_06700 [Chloroflexi bacterium HGW-Chloroflexi-1]